MPGPRGAVAGLSHPYLFIAQEAIVLEMSMSQHVCHSLTEEPWTIGTEGSANRCLFRSIKNCWASFSVRWTDPFIGTTRERSRCAQPPQHLWLSVFFTLALLVSMWGSLTVVSLPSCGVPDHFSEFHFESLRAFF